jgi:hypothetical protein
MFTFTVTTTNLFGEVFYDFCLYYADGSISMHLTQENPGKIVIAEEGQFDSSPSNGSFNFKWNKEYFSFEVGKYGDGNGGTLLLKIKNTPELYLTFVNALEQWNTHVL